MVCERNPNHLSVKLFPNDNSFITGASRRLEPVIKCCLFLSFFQCLVSRAPLSAVTIVVIVKLEGIPDSTKIIIFEGTKTSTIFTRDYFMSENLRVDRKYSCSSAISTLEGIENKQRLQTYSIDNAWSNKNFLFYLTFRMLQHTSSEVTVYNTSNN